MTGEFAVVVETPLTPAQAWARVWDLDRHSEVIPLTVVSSEPPGTALADGVRFGGRTALGPVGFDDPMQVLVWEPPAAAAGRAVVAKVGRVIAGRIDVAFTPLRGAHAERGTHSVAPPTRNVGPKDDAAAGGGTLITWRQVVQLPWLPSPLSPLEHVVARLVAPGYRTVLRRLLV